MKVYLAIVTVPYLSIRRPRTNLATRTKVPHKRCRDWPRPWKKLGSFGSNRAERWSSARYGFTPKTEWAWLPLKIVAYFLKRAIDRHLTQMDRELSATGSQ
jgi:hypothetical protein